MKKFFAHLVSNTEKSFTLPALFYGGITFKVFNASMTFRLGWCFGTTGILGTLGSAPRL